MTVEDAISGLDAARRAGWAKFYEEERRAKQLESNLTWAQLLADVTEAQRRHLEDVALFAVELFTMSAMGVRIKEPVSALTELLARVVGGARAPVADLFFDGMFLKHRWATDPSLRRRAVEMESVLWDAIGKDY